MSLPKFIRLAPPGAAIRPAPRPFRVPCERRAALALVDVDARTQPLNTESEPRAC